MTLRAAFLVALTLAIACARAEDAAAQAYPSRPIRMVVPTTAGGPTDTIARIMADGMRAPLGQPIVIENVPGASGSIGVGRVAKAAPDGYTLGLGNEPWYVFNGALYDLPYDLANSFDEVALFTRDPMILVGRKDLAARDLKELIAWLKANPGKALAGTAGNGSVGHIFGVSFERATGTRLQFVPFRGFAEATTDLMGGHIDVIIGLAAGLLPQVRVGAIRAYAVFEPTRLASDPAIPTADEAGVPGTVLRGLARLLRAKGNAAGDRRAAQCRNRRGAERSGRARAHGGDRPEATGRARADAGGARRPSQGRDRQVVAVHQASRHQGGVRRGGRGARVRP